MSKAKHVTPSKFSFVLDKLQHQTPFVTITFEVTKQQAAELQVASTQAFLDGPNDGVPSIEFRFVPAKKTATKKVGDVAYRGIGGLDEEDDE